MANGTCRCLCHKHTRVPLVQFVPAIKGAVTLVSAHRCMLISVAIEGEQVPESFNTRPICVNI